MAGNTTANFSIGTRLHLYEYLQMETKAISGVTPDTKGLVAYYDNLYVSVPKTYGASEYEFRSVVNKITGGSGVSAVQQDDTGEYVISVSGVGTLKCYTVTIAKSGGAAGGKSYINIGSPVSTAAILAKAYDVNKNEVQVSVYPYGNDSNWLVADFGSNFVPPSQLTVYILTDTSPTAVTGTATPPSSN